MAGALPVERNGNGGVASPSTAGITEPGFSPVRFIHAADIHLDSPLSALKPRGGEPARALADSTRRAFTAMIDAAVELGVDFVVIAGDLYDGDWPHIATGLFFAEQMVRLHQAGIRAAVVKGNHDAASRITRHIVTEMPNTVIFDHKRPETVVWEDLGVALHGQSFANGPTTGNLAASYPAPRPGYLNIGVLHTAAEGRPGHDSYAPCTVGQLAAHGYDYWALGHVHRREVLSEAPWIVFPGNMQGRHVNEPGAKGFSLVHADAGAIRSVEHRPCDVLRWARVAVDATGCADAESVNRRVQEALADAAAAADGRALAVRLTLTGETAAHRRLAADPEQVEADCCGAAVWTGHDVWIETIRLKTRPPGAAPAPEPASADALETLLRTMGDVRGDPALLDRIRGDAGTLVEKLPPLARRHAGLDTIGDDLFADIVAEAEALLLARLLDEGRGP